MNRWDGGGERLVRVVDEDVARRAGRRRCRCGPQDARLDRDERRVLEFRPVEFGDWARPEGPAGRARGRSLRRPRRARGRAVSISSEMVSSTSRRTRGPKRRRSSSRSRDFTRSSVSSSSISRSALRVTRNAWCLQDLHAFEQLRQVRGDDVFERDETLAAASRNRGSAGGTLIRANVCRPVCGSHTSPRG